MYLIVFIHQLVGIWSFLRVSPFFLPDDPQAQEGRVWMHMRQYIPQLQPYEITYVELINWGWTLCLAVEEAEQIVANGEDGWRETERISGYFKYFYDPSNLLDLFNYSMVLLAAAIRMAVFYGRPEIATMTLEVRPDWRDAFISEHSMEADELLEATKSMKVVQVIYAVVILTLCFRWLESFTIYERFGILRLMISNMVVDVVWWLTFVIVLSIAMGVSYTVLMPAIAYEVEDAPLFRPLWGLLGDFDTETIHAYFEEYGDGNDHRHHLLKITMLVLCYIYTFFMTIVMVNLLIAQMSSRYEGFVEEGHETWLKNRVELIKEYKDNRRAIPAPFNVPYALLHSLPKALYSFVLWAKDGFPQPSTEVNESRGFKLGVGGRTAHHAGSVSSHARDAFLVSSDTKRKQSPEGRIEKLTAGQEWLHEKVDGLGVQMEQLMAATREEMRAMRKVHRETVQSAS